MVHTVIQVLLARRRQRRRHLDRPPRAGESDEPPTGALPLRGRRPSARR